MAKDILWKVRGREVTANVKPAIMRRRYQIHS